MELVREKRPLCRHVIVVNGIDCDAVATRLAFKVELAFVLILEVILISYDAPACLTGVITAEDLPFFNLPASLYSWSHGRKKPWT